MSGCGCLLLCALGAVCGSVGLALILVATVVR